MKIYISGAISNTDNYMERFAKAEKGLTENGYSAINPAKVNAQLPEDTSYEEYMKMSFCMLDICDGVYFINGWEDSKGCLMEYGFSIKKGIGILYENNK